MKECAKWVIVSLALLVPALPAGGARAQQSSLADSIAAADETTEDEADSTRVDRIKPVWTSSMRAGFSDLSLGSTMLIKLDPGCDWLVNGSVNINKQTYRGRDVEGLSETMTANATKLLPGLFMFNAAMVEMYNKKTTLGMSRYGKDIVFDSKNINMKMTVDRKFLKASRSQIQVNGSLNRGLEDFKFDSEMMGGAGGFLGYSIGDYLDVCGGIGASSSRESSEIGPVKFDGLTSRMDSIGAYLKCGKGKEKLIDAKYTRRKGVKRVVNLPKGNYLQVLDDPESALREESHRRTENFELKSFVQPFGFLSIRVNFKHGFSRMKNMVDERLDRESENSEIATTARYQYASRGTATVTIQNAKSSDDRGPQSISSYDEKAKSVAVSISHLFADSLSVSIRGASSLKQKFFKKYEQNPRDADVLSYYGSALLKSKLFERISVVIDVSAGRYERVNIDRSLSGDNRFEYNYKLSPSYTVKPSGWIELKQKYTIKIDYTDFVYRAEENFLNRNTTVETMASFRIKSSITCRFKHLYLLKDTGSYRERGGGERAYSPFGEDIDNDLGLALMYTPSEGFEVLAKADFRNQKSNQLGDIGGRTGVISSVMYDSGGLVLGFKRKRKFAGKGEVDLDVSYVRRFGPNLAEIAREYWDVDASITYNF